MTGIDKVQLQKVIVHKVGNPTRGEQLKLSENPLTLNDEQVKQLLGKYFLQGFNDNELYHFTHLSDVGLNEVFTYVKTFFHDTKSFLEVSANLARFLYSKSTHVRVKEGELYVALLEDVPFENDFVSAVGIFKSESKESFLKVFEHGQSLEVTAEDGININKVDKGCLVFKTNEADGYALCVLDNTNKQQDAQYWVKDFLQVEPVANDYHFTNEYLQVVKQFATQEMPEHFEVTKGQQIDLMQRGLEYFKEKDQFNLQEFTDTIIQYDEMKQQFAEFTDNYARSKSMTFENEFDINLSAVKKQSKAFKNVLKLDKNFHIYIHGRRDLIERGFDEQTGKHYYKLYFEEEA
ncbi:MAG: nucleoid-associated protein [Bacteroidota bacterium]